MKREPPLAHVGLAVVVSCVLVQASPAFASVPGDVAAARVSEASYRHFLDDMLYTHDGDNRGPYGPEHDLARDNIAMLMSHFGLDVTLEPFDWEGNTYYNVAGTKTGATYPEQIYVMGAHFDSVDNPGADDNASGVALMLETARVLSDYDSDYTVRFVAFNLEERGIGSFEYVDEHLDDDIVGMISWDMVAYDMGTYSVSIESTRAASEPWQIALADAVETYGGGLTPVVGTGGGSDHIPFEWAGIPACLLIESATYSNPYFHAPEDSVDTPCYIDYAYAAQITRAAVGFLVDQAGISVPIPNADHDADGDVDMDDYAQFDLCFDPGVSPGPECGFFDLDVDDDVDCTDWKLFEVVWTGPPGDPPVYTPCRSMRPSGADAGSRCISVRPPDTDAPMALLVRGWPAEEDVSCVWGYVQSEGRLGALPVHQTRDEWGTVTVCDEAIIPSVAYTVEGEFENGGDPSMLAEVCVIMASWGDTVGHFADGAWTPPDGMVDFNDITSLVDAFRHLPTAPPTYRADLVGASGTECIPDMNIDFLDISAAVEAFRGHDYWETASCPPPCD